MSDIDSILEFWLEPKPKPTTLQERFDAFNLVEHRDAEGLRIAQLPP